METVILQEYEIDKTLGIKGPEDVAKMGIEAYNNECRKIVMRYSSDWEVRIWRNVTRDRLAQVNWNKKPPILDLYIFHL